MHMNAYQMAFNSIIGCFAVLTGVIIMFSDKPLTIDEFAMCFTDRGSIVFIIVYILIEFFKRSKHMKDYHTILKIFYKKHILKQHKQILEKQHKQVLDILCTAVIIVEEENLTYFNH